eukprot:3206797-Prymnesium_polylepis.2
MWADPSGFCASTRTSLSSSKDETWPEPSTSSSSKSSWAMSPCRHAKHAARAPAQSRSAHADLGVSGWGAASRVSVAGHGMRGGALTKPMFMIAVVNSISFISPSPLLSYWAKSDITPAPERHVAACAEKRKNSFIETWPLRSLSMVSNQSRMVSYEWRSRLRSGSIATNSSKSRLASPSTSAARKSSEHAVTFSCVFWLSCFFATDSRLSS